MNLINEEITHKVFGEGNIVEHEESIITVDFNKNIKKFVYPDAFEKFITLKNENTAKTFKKLFLQRQLKEEILEKKREEEKEIQMLEQARIDKMKNHRIHESSQIVFWLDDVEQENVFTDWQVFTGEVQSGKNKGEPNRATRVSLNSAGLLTARGPEQPETERQILGLYMVNESYIDNVVKDGMVPSDPEFRIELTNEEAEQMLFWNYYINKNYPHRTTWNSGKFRYFDNIWTAQILKDIILIKTDEEQIKYAENFLAHFCQVNALDIDNIPEVHGALKQ
ncbi:malate synthase [Sporosarcina sp. FA9]|uniref:malate synthase n=1 Tax=Sporosarcina sp. FA9 TaxID=3413030 RepID=UPI003F65DFDB